MEQSHLKPIKYNVHSCLQSKEPRELKKISEKLSLPVHLMLFNLDGNMNIAMSIRSAAVLGCSDVWIIGRRKYDARPEVGSHNYIRVHKLPFIDPATFFKEHDLEPFLVEQGGIPLEDINFKPFMKKPICFIMGNEGEGLPAEMLRTKFPKITISQYGLVRSLNVSMAATVVMYEFVKQWRNIRKDF